MSRFLTLVLILGFGALASTVRAQPTPPAPGVDIPPSLRGAFDQSGRFQFGHAWIEKARAAKQERERYVADRGFFKRNMMSSARQQQLAVTGTLRVPVFCVKYSDTPGTPFPISQLQTKLFTGPYSPQTLTQYYNEISFGALNLTGTVYGWHTLPFPNSHYVPPDTCFGLCGTTDELIHQTLAANDAAVNFGQYDNDGPDGIPNSGDDDGYVDFAAFVQPESGGECAGNPLTNIWSHRSQVVPTYVTNDPHIGGAGFIRVSDYVIQPIYNCDNTTLIDIGVFCHEFGHALGLPDLYDTDGGSRGVGNWCLMGHGSWNSTSQPAHMGAWARSELGWADISLVSGSTVVGAIPAVETNQTVYRIDCAAQKFRWAGCWLGDDEALRCNLQIPEANNRNWASPGYGNNWDVSIARDFHYNGTGNVTLSWDVAWALAPNDFAYATLKRGNNTYTIKTYTGVGAEAGEDYNLTPYLTAPGPYTISFRVKTSPGSSDEDGGFPTTCGAFGIFSITLFGGGENYFTIFQDRADGWAQDPPFTEYFLVENRQPLGSDVNLPGSGLVVWHIDQANQTGGVNNNRPRGVEVEQADGLGHLEANVNYGDAGDPFPGSTNKMLFTQGTNPSSLSHSGSWPIHLQLLSGNGSVITANMFGGFWPPNPEEVAPPAGTSGQMVQLQIDGSGFKKTPTALLTPFFPEEEMKMGVVRTFEFASTSVEWLGEDRIIAEFDLTGAPNGVYDVVVFNPGGASSRLQGVYSISGGTTGVGDAPQKFGLSPNYPNPFNPSTTIRFALPSRESVDLRVYDVTGALVRTLVNESKAAGTYSVQWNGRDDHGEPVSSGVYFYRLTAGDFSDVRKMTLVK